MKKKGKILIGCLIIILLVLLGISIYHFIKNMEADKRKTLQTMETIKEKYKSFSPMVEEFTKKRTSFYAMKDEMLYLENVEENQEEILNFMTEYESFVLNVHKENDYLEKNCQRKYSDNRVNNTCNLFKQGYEAVMNYYITDLKVYNEFIESYNQWAEENNIENTLESKTFSLYTSYIDYDKDGSYLGGK